MGDEYQCDKYNFISDILVSLKSSKLWLPNSHIIKIIELKEFLEIALKELLPQPLILISDLKMHKSHKKVSEP